MSDTLDALLMFLSPYMLFSLDLHVREIKAYIKEKGRICAKSCIDIFVQFSVMV